MELPDHGAGRDGALAHHCRAAGRRPGGFHPDDRGLHETQPGRDLFVDNLRIRHVRITHGADTFELDLDIDERGLQALVVHGGGGEWRIELDAWEAGAREDYRELCISELRFMGIPGTAALAGPTSLEISHEELDAEMAEIADELEAEAEENGELNPDGEAPGVVLSQRTGLHLSEMLLAPEMDRRTPVDPRNTYSKSGDERVNCFFRLQNPEREETEVTISWEDEEGESRNEPTAIPVPPNRAFTHWRYTGTSWRRPGSYQCVIRSAEGEELGRAPFQLVE